MNERTKTGLQILQVAVILGVLGDVLLRAMPWGLNVLLFNMAFAGGMIMLLRRRAPEYLTGQTLSLFAAQVFFASMFVWRDSIELRLADTAAIVLILSVLVLPKMKVTTQLAGVFHYAAGFVWSGLHAIGAPFLLVFNDVEWPALPREGWRKHAFSVVRGLAVAAPLIFIFGALFMAADAAYEGLVQRVFNIKPETVVTHILMFSIFAWMSAGYLRGVLMVPVGQRAAAKTETAETVQNPESKFERVARESGEYPVTLPDNLSVVEHLNISDPPNKQAETRPVGSLPSFEKNQPKQWEWADIDNTLMPPAFTLGTVEIGVILGLTNLLFLSFVIVQVPYLFGGMDLVQNTPDFKLAEYARRGFGELVTVSALVLPILLASHWLIKKENPTTQKLFRILAGIQIALLFVIMASAAQRLLLLTGNLGYGLTTIRLYPMIFMMWLALVFIWFGMTVLRGARQHFAWGALWSAFLILGATHVLNPDAFIVKTNIALAQQGREFDAGYNSNLSNDATPVLINSFDALTEHDQQVVIRRIAKRYCENRNESDLRSWNFSRSQASNILESNHLFVNEIGNCDTKTFAYSRVDEF